MSILVRDGALVNALSAWTAFQASREAPTRLARCGFTGSVAAINRVNARYRLARSFQGVVLDGYASHTVLAYSALLRLLLSYSAFELYLPIIGADARTFSTPDLSTSSRSLTRRLRSIDPENLLFTRVQRDLTGRENKNQVAAFLSGAPCLAVYLVSSVRHVFAHGPLPALPTGVPHDRLIQAADALSQFILKCLDDDFSSRIKGNAV
jgi:hypothetical protein